jgi:glycine/D-amino acid oxidase-like deaminating enzyme
MTVQEKNYWLETATIPRGESGPLPESIDVAVVGSGVTGLSAARALAKRGVGVAVLEAETLGWGASSRNGGMVLTGMKLPVPTLISRYGREKVQRMYAASIASIDCVERIVREDQIDCNFSRCGHLEVACKQAHFDGYAESAALIAREFNHKLRIVAKSELRSEIGSDIYYGGLVDEVSAGLNPARYVAGLAAGAKRAGAVLFDHARVESVQRESSNGAQRFRVRTTKGGLLAREVLLASGAYTSVATPALRKKIIPIGSYIIATEVLSGDLAHELSPKNRMIYDSKHFLYYYRLTPDRRMLFGGRAAFFPETENTVRQSAEILRRGMIHVYPRHQSGICLGRNAGFRFRRHATHRAQRRHALFGWICRTRRGHRNLSRNQNRRRHLRRAERHSFRWHPISQSAHWSAQRSHLGAAAGGSVLQVSGLGELRSTCAAMKHVFPSRPSCHSEERSDEESVFVARFSTTDSSALKRVRNDNLRRERNQGLTLARSPSVFLCVLCGVLHEPQRT